MKKFLYFSAFAMFAGSAYWYFRNQLRLALSYEYDIDKWRVVELDTEHLELSAEVTLMNKSSFEIEVLEYDLSIFYKDILVARTFSVENFHIAPDSSTPVKVNGEVVFDEAKKAVLPMALNILARKPISVSVAGHVKVKFLGFDHTIRFEKDEYQYSSDVLKDFGLDDNWEKLQEKIPFLKKIR